MPQMGESIAEGTIVRWIKKIGDTVDRDEPLFEISTDKVDAEIPSPAAGTLLEITVKEGETVAVNSVVATIGAAGEGAAPTASAVAAPTPAAATSTPPSGKTAAPSPQPDWSSAPSSATPGQPSTGRDGRKAPDTTKGFERSQELSASQDAVALGRSDSESPDDARQKSSPLVRRIAAEHGVDIRQITGSGIAGRVTKNDILGYIENGGATAGLPEERAQSAAPGAPADRTTPSAPTAPVHRTAPAAADRIEPMSVMRKKIAEHMVISRRTSAHVYSVFEVNYSRVDQIRKERRAEYEQRGVKVTFTSFIAKAAIDCLRRHPVINASIDGENVIYKRDVNLGIAVALENGLIVPVIKSADELNLLGLSRAIADVADRARAKKLQPEEVHGGTFTITNPGNFGAQFGLPIINQPQVAILGVGNIEKRPVVIDDMIGIRLMGYLTLGYDHRLVDGAVADQFMAEIKKSIETFDPSQV
jgi:pyruvate dehydrogenase E2 component (dihydrolipoamide acetyltransferase)